MRIDYQNRPWPMKAYHIMNYTLNPHLHNQIEVVYVIRGTCSMSIDKIRYEVRQGDFIIILPYQIHSFYNVQECELVVQVFEPDFAPELLPHLGNCLLKNSVVKEMSHDCVEAFRKAEQYYTQQSDLRIVRAYIGVYMSFLYDKLEFIAMDTSDYYSVLHELLLYIDFHFTEHMTLEVLAEKFHITRFYISRLFSKKMNTSFNDYVNQLRVDYATELLCHTDMTIGDIALKSGFECERNFYRVFKRHTDMTPLQKRKQGDDRSVEADY